MSHGLKVEYRVAFSYSLLVSLPAFSKQSILFNFQESDQALMPDKRY
jgi:hypothetical protein